MVLVCSAPAHSAPPPRHGFALAAKVAPGHVRGLLGPELLGSSEDAGTDMTAACRGFRGNARRGKALRPIKLEGLARRGD